LPPNPSLSLSLSLSIFPFPSKFLESNFLKAVRTHKKTPQTVVPRHQDPIFPELLYEGFSSIFIKTFSF
jgi:hypothetical protein